MKMFQKLAIVAALLLVSLDAQAMRWHSPSTGRWLSRDPIEEKGGKNLCMFVENNPLIFYDNLGLYPSLTVDYDTCCKNLADIAAAYLRLMKAVQAAQDANRVPEDIEGAVSCLLGSKKGMTVQCGGLCCSVQKKSAQGCSIPGASTVYLCHLKGSHKMGTVIAVEIAKANQCSSALTDEYALACWLDSL